MPAGKRNPIAKALRIHSQKVIPDKREKLKREAEARE
jgi:hypothetical protein